MWYSIVWPLHLEQNVWCSHHCQRVFMNPERRNCTITNWTVCWQPVRLTGFLLPQLASGQNITHMQHFSQARKGYFQPSRLLHYLFSIEKTHREERQYTDVQYFPKLLSLRRDCLSCTSMCLWQINHSALLWNAFISICEEVQKMKYR